MKPGAQFTIQLEAGVSGESLLLMGERVSLMDADTVETWETITRTVKFDDDYYGEVEITDAMLQTMVDNFKANTFGQDLSIDISHDFSGGSAGFIRELTLDNGRLRGRIEWTEFGREAVTKKGFRYFSADFHPNYKDPETGKKHGPLLQGAAITTRPRVKNLDAIDPSPLQLSATTQDNRHIALTPLLARQLTTEIVEMKEKYLAILLSALAGLKLPEPMVAGFKLSWEQAFGDTSDDAAARLITENVITLAGTAAEQIKLAATPPASDPAPVQLSADQISDIVKKQLAAQQAAAAEALRLAAAGETTQRKRFTDALDKHEGMKSLNETQRNEIIALGETITAAHTDATVDAMAASAIKLADSLVVAAKLQAQGYGAPGGVVRLTQTDADAVTKMQAQIDESLKKSANYRLGKIKLAEPSADSFGSVLLAEFDRVNAAALYRESIMLAGGEVVISNTNLPVGFQRTVIRESLADLNIMQLVNATVDPSSTATTQIPYELRDTSQVVNQGIVYEGAEIPPAGITQAMDLAYINPMKISMNLSNEVVHFSAASGINWDAWARNVESNGRVMAELTAARLANEYQRSADAYGAVAVSAEAFDAQLGGGTHTIKLANFPLVRPHQEKDLQGTNVGSAENPITLTLNGVAITPYDGSNTQSAGTYYRVTDYNMGYIQLVSELGVAVTPVDTGVNTISYSYATNVVKFDLDIAAGLTNAQHLNGLLEAVGARQAILKSERFVKADFLLMSSVLNDKASNAETFTAQAARNGADTDAAGDLQRIKMIAAYGTDAAGIDLGVSRILMGPRGTLGLTIAKPWMIGPTFEAVGASGRPTGKRIAYGEQYVGLKVPTPIRDRLTSVIAYSATARAAFDGT